LQSDLYRAPIRGIELLKGAAPTHLELNRQRATELPGTIPNVRERRKPPLLIVFPVNHLGAISTNKYDTGNKHHLRKRLQELPEDLHEQFCNIMTRDNKHHNGFLLCIQWVLFPAEPLTPKQLYYAILSGFEPQYLTDCNTIDISDNDIQKYVLDKSKGLVELTISRNPTIQFVHESVRDFLLKENGLSRIFAKLGTNITWQSHEELKDCCLAYL
jgi:hypothetical protein